MNVLIHGLESLFSAMPLSLLEIWGRLAYILGALIAPLAYGGFTLRPGGQWGLGRIQQAWDSRTLLCIGLTFTLLPLSGWLGSNIVLVEGAQTFESLKDVMVFLTIVLFGYPALLAVPPAYMLSDLIEGVPPGFVFDWLPGYFFWAAFVWMAHQLIGREPDFRRARTWPAYALFVLLLMTFDPVMWGFICSTQFTSEIAFRTISPALATTLLITWLTAPLAMLAALPLARRFGLFWLEAPGFVTERLLGGNATSERGRGVPLRLVLVGSFMSLVLVLVGAAAYFALRSGQQASEQLATQLHQEVAANLNLQLDAALEHAPASDAERLQRVEIVLTRTSIAKTGRAFVLDRKGAVLAGTPDAVPRADAQAMIRTALASLNTTGVKLHDLHAPNTFRFDVVTAKPLSRVSWLAQITPYSDNAGSVDWLVLTALPESHYLASLQSGGSQAAMLSAIALTLALALAALLAGWVVAPIRRIAQSAEAMAAGQLQQEAPQQVRPSALKELDALVNSFNRMGAQLHAQFERARSSEARSRAIFDASPAAMAVFDARDFAPGAVAAGKPARLVDVNLAWQSTTGHARDEVPEKTSQELDLWQDANERERLARQFFLEGQVTDFHAQLKRADDQAFEAQISMRRVHVDDTPLAIFVVEDVTERHQARAELLELNRQLSAAQDALLALNAGLDQRVRERTQQLVQAEKLASLGQIVGRVAHEMNTPLGISITAASTLQERTAELVKALGAGPIKRAMLDDYLGASTEGLQMLNEALARAHDLLTHFKQVAVDQGSGKRRAFDLRSCLDGVTALMRTTLRGTDYRIEMDVAEGIQMDTVPGAIEQIFINLVNNAVLHGFAAREQGVIEVTATHDESTVRLHIADNGHGMTPTVLKRIFDPFFTTAVNRGGSGLGLTICFNLVTGVLGGQMVVESEVGRGTRFTMTLPRVGPDIANQPT